MIQPSFHSIKICCSSLVSYTLPLTHQFRISASRFGARIWMRSHLSASSTNRSRLSILDSGTGALISTSSSSPHHSMPPLPSISNTYFTPGVQISWSLAICTYESSHKVLYLTRSLSPSPHVPASSSLHSPTLKMLFLSKKNLASGLNWSINAVWIW